MSRKLILFITTSLDGYIARDNGDVDWLFTDQDYGYSEFYDSIDTLLIGRKTYEQCLSFGEYPYPGKKCIVFASRPVEKPTGEDIQVTAEEPLKIVEKLRQQPGKDIWLLGGAEIIKSLHGAGEIDEYRIFVHPIVLGNGISLFQNGSKEASLKLIQSQQFSSGMVELRYNRT